VYPGYFRTEFLAAGSLVLPARRIGSYAAARQSEVQHVEQIHGNQPGDPVKAARAMIDVYERPAAPLHLFLGSDAVAMAEGKLAQVHADIRELRAVSVSTDF
jgi:hypothetical protein